MHLDPDPQTARQQLLLWAVTLVSFVAVVSTFGLSAWYSPLLVLAPMLTVFTFIVYRARKKRREEGAAK